METTSSSTGPEQARERASRRWAVAPACVLALLMPGAGHAFLGARQRGAFFCLALSALFGLGLSLDARLTLHAGLDDPLALVIGIGQMAMGLPYVLARALGFAAGDVRSAGFDYGIAFTSTAGLLNVLVALDVVDIAQGRKA
jgi:uncharacterized protein DUF6677